MTIQQLLKARQLDNSILIGYYGGGNFGDELLLSVLLRALKDSSAENVEYYYSNKRIHKLLHSNTPYTPIFGHKALLKKLLTKRSIVIGGGGHWGLDMNKNVLLLSAALLIMRFIFNKKIYALGVGFYDSTNQMGRISAYCVAKACDVILARDKESYKNFSRYTKKVKLDRDIAFMLQDLNLSAYHQEADQISKLVGIQPKEKYTILVLRRFQNKYKNGYRSQVERLVRERLDSRLILFILEPKEVDPEGFNFLKRLQKENGGVAISDFQYSPLAFVEFCKLNANNVALIAPQYHAQLVAGLFGMPHLPLVYDNKVGQLLESFGKTKVIDINNLKYTSMKKFIYDHQT